MYCPNCGTKLADDASFCSNCSAQVNVFNNNIKNWELYLKTHNNQTNSQYEDRNIKNPINPVVAIPAIVLYTIFMYVIIFCVMGYNFSFSASHYDYFINELEMYGFTENNNVYSYKSVTDNNEPFTVVFDTNNNYFIEYIDNYTYTYDYQNDVFLFELDESYYTINFEYKFSTEEYVCTANPSEWDNLCSSYKSDLISTADKLKESYDAYLSSLNVNTEDIIREVS